MGSGQPPACCCCCPSWANFDSLGITAQGPGARLAAGWSLPGIAVLAIRHSAGRRAGRGSVLRLQRVSPCRPLLGERRKPQLHRGLGGLNEGFAAAGGGAWGRNLLLMCAGIGFTGHLGPRWLCVVYTGDPQAASPAGHRDPTTTIQAGPAAADSRGFLSLPQKRGGEGGFQATVFEAGAPRCGLCPAKADG